MKEFPKIGDRVSFKNPYGPGRMYGVVTLLLETVVEVRCPARECVVSPISILRQPKFLRRLKARAPKEFWILKPVAHDARMIWSAYTIKPPDAETRPNEYVHAREVKQKKEISK